MGYTLTVKVPDAELRTALLRFLSENYRPLDSLAPRACEQSAMRGPYIGTELSYDRRPTVIGFDYSSVDQPEQNYVSSILAWVAIVGGDRYKGRPYICYDGTHQRWPLFWDDEPEALRKTGITVFNHLGLTRYDPIRRVAPRFTAAMRRLFPEAFVARVNGVVAVELERLNALWLLTAESLRKLRV